jgi:NOG1 N-terminal helical domain
MGPFNPLLLLRPSSNTSTAVVTSRPAILLVIVIVLAMLNISVHTSRLCNRHSDLLFGMSSRLLVSTRLSATAQSQSASASASASIRSNILRRVASSKTPRPAKVSTNVPAAVISLDAGSAAVIDSVNAKGSGKGTDANININSNVNVNVNTVGSNGIKPQSAFVEVETIDTGAFKSRLPNIYAAATHFDRAQKTLRRVGMDKNIKNIRNANRKLTAQSLDTLMKALTSPLTEILDSYRKTFRELHPFEATVANLTVISRVKAGHRDLESMLADIKALRAQTSKIAKEYAGQAHNCTTAAEAKALLQSGIEDLQALYDSSVKKSLDGNLALLHSMYIKLTHGQFVLPCVTSGGGGSTG